MTDWLDFSAALDFGELVPEQYGRYRPAIAEGLRFFLEALSTERALAILEEQASLPETASLGERLVAIARHCPALHKLGQVLARDPRLSADLRRLLQQLETMRPRVPPAAILADLEGELGPLAALGIRVDEPPLAEASVAIVQPFVWRDGEGQSHRGVFKLLKRGIEERLNEDLDILQRIGELLDERCHAYGLPAIDYADTFGQVRDLLAREVHLESEQRHMATARALYANDPRVVVPEVFPFSTPRVTAMSRLEGQKVTDVHDLPRATRHRLAGVMVDALLAQPLWSSGPVTMFHADPHAGNLMATTDGRLGLLDWSLVGRIGKTDQINLTQLLLGAITLDRVRIVGAIVAIADGDLDEARLREIVEGHVKRLRQGEWLSLGWLTSLMDEALTQAGARFGPGLVIYRKVLHTLKGVIADVAPDFRVDKAIALAFLKRFLVEAPERAVASPNTRHFATHLSNVDLAHLAVSLPIAGSLYWLGLQQDALMGEGPPSWPRARPS